MLLYLPWVCNDCFNNVGCYVPQILSLPLGVKLRSSILNKARALLKTNYTKVTELVINNSGWKHRYFTLLLHYYLHHCCVTCN